MKKYNRIMTELLVKQINYKLQLQDFKSNINKCFYRLIDVEIEGQQVLIEVTFEQDNRSEAEFEYRKQLEESGALYVPVNSPEEFEKWLFNFQNLNK